MNAVEALIDLLRHPEGSAAIPLGAWTQILAVARAETLLGTLAYRLDGRRLPAVVAAVLADAKDEAEQVRRAALWEANRIALTLAPLGHPVILLKGTAFVAAGLAAGRGRGIGDCDILLPHALLDRAEAYLLDAGWEWLKSDPYDDLYYRRWMHELPPLVHGERGHMVDVHHTILPPTARPKPDAEALIADAEMLAGGLATLCHTDMIVHAAAHLFADGELSGGLRNLWDIHALIEERGMAGLKERARHHGLSSAVGRALRLSHALYGTAVPDAWHKLNATDKLYRRRMTARDGWARERRRLTRTAFYIRSHAIRMPLPLLARHLWIKWRKGKAAPASE
ncbi:nucleotidyltransferase family protein [Sphingomonas sp. CFBP8993]|uniref:nucleotidyltransferase domain-containing protein n=1 Tax=Sphingomonas sp. CFBP8993 TaxID=3096526 RepID=UPI002A6A42DD|nr:nucleotidyltransferase family protein [Sphingomonas sp. CFBP8993]MDY0957334.1 nucleotidyltransferase family protein [Sphingomonas sp. CFBP8993]